jgi:ABC-type antimicrobial peptide transport system permease subunit
LPIVTTIGGQIGFLFAGVVLVETVFAWPSLGRLVVRARTKSNEAPSYAEQYRPITIDRSMSVRVGQT